MDWAINTAAMRQSLDPMGVFKSPLAQGRIDRAYENLEVILLKGPNQHDLDVVGTLAAAGHAGAFGRIVEFIQNGDLAEVEALDIANVGLQQVMEGEHVTFLIYGCSRAFTHEMVRTRKGAWFLQQTLRHTDMGKANVRMPETLSTGEDELASCRRDWISSIHESIRVYRNLIDDDVPYEDARTVLPLATETWIIAGMPLRTWLETYEYRACHMFYPEMRWVFRRMKEELAKAAPKVAEFAHITCERRKICTYRGAEDTSSCPLRQANHWDREWQSPQYDDRTLLLQALGVKAVPHGETR